MSVCKHIADTLKMMIMDEDIKQLSVGALQQVNLDLVQCESKCYMRVSIMYLCICALAQFLSYIL